jgi:glycosyltransferase involved in cell wall biosynthesis
VEDKILFIMPSINRDSIIRAVDSVRSQTDDRWHLCIVYDAVENPTVQEEDKITCINLESKLGVGQNGAGNVRNVAIDKFGKDYKWIGFIDDDDELDKDYVKLLFSKYNAYDLVVFRMKRKHDILPPTSYNKLDPCKVGISFCYKAPSNVRFIPSHMEDFQFLEDLQKEKRIIYSVTEEIGYYVRGAK